MYLDRFLLLLKLLFLNSLNKPTYELISNKIDFFLYLIIITKKTIIQKI